MQERQEIQSTLPNFTGTENWYRHPLVRNVLYTDGAKYVAVSCDAYWLLDAIASYQIEAPMRDQDFQTWTFKRSGPDDLARATPHQLVGTDGNGKQLVVQNIDYTDFPLDSIDIWVEYDGTHKVILLPSEH